MNVCLREYPLRLELRSVRPQRGAAVIEHADQLAAWNFLKSQTNRMQAMAELRQRLPSSPGSAALSDDDVLRDVARQLVGRSLYLIVLDGAGGSAAGAAAAGGAAGEYEAPPKRAAVSPPAPLPPPSKKPAAIETPAAAPETTAALDQDTQAAALEQAAVSGVPFCAACEKAKADRLAATR